MWQKSGNQGDEWQRAYIHVTLQEVHQVIVEATVGGEAGDIAIDDISFISGPCPASGNMTETGGNHEGLTVLRLFGALLTILM